MIHETGPKVEWVKTGGLHVMRKKNTIEMFLTNHDSIDLES